MPFTSWALTFAQTPPSASTGGLAPGQTSQWILSLKNTGSSLSGNIAVACYVTAPKPSDELCAASHGRLCGVLPHRSVFDFTRVEGLAAGQSRLISMTLTPRGRSVVDEDGYWLTPLGKYSVQCEAGGEAKTAAASMLITEV